MPIEKDQCIIFTHLFLCFVSQILRLPILLPVQNAAASGAIYNVENACLYKENNKIMDNPLKEKINAHARNEIRLKNTYKTHTKV